MTEEEMCEVFAIAEAIGVPPWKKKLAISRLLEKGILTQPEPRRVEITNETAVALGKIMVSW
jgi:hypothetical protein